VSREDSEHAVTEPAEPDVRQPHVVRLPGFLSDEEPVGLGDVVKSVTRTLGVRPCGGCERRAVALNRWLVFTRRAK
jgi:hypothetical protein